MITAVYELNNPDMMLDLQAPGVSFNQSDTMILIVSYTSTTNDMLP
jgi:hypothetical protein